jgi:hypothetical protein
MKALVLSFLILAASGCTTASMVNYPGRNTSAYGPSNASSLPGTISYLNQGADIVIQRRRDNAYKQMYDACNGRYSILSEGSQTQGGVATSMGSSTFYSPAQYWYISFKCD